MTNSRPLSSPSCFVYVLGCVHNGRALTYVGWSNDVARRLAQHNAGTGARTTRGRAWTLLHTEAFATRGEAMSREWHLKRDRAFRKALAEGMRVADVVLKDQSVMAGLDPAIHVLPSVQKDVDARVKPAHDAVRDRRLRSSP